MAGASRMVALTARKIGCGLSTIGVLEKHLKFYSGTETGTIVEIINKNLLEKNMFLSLARVRKRLQPKVSY